MQPLAAHLTNKHSRDHRLILNGLEQSWGYPSSEGYRKGGHHHGSQTNS